MSIGRTSTFIDIYAERDLANGTFTEEQIQEFVDHFIMKLRMVKFARTPEYQALFTGDPQWVTESIGGMGVDGRTLVTKMSYRYLHTLENMGTSPEPNMTVLWSTRLPENFKSSAPRLLSPAPRSSTRTTTSCAFTTATTTVSPAACPPCALARKCSSSALAPTWPKCLLYARSTAASTRSLRSRSAPSIRAVEGRYPRLRRRCGQVQRHDEVARRRVRQLAEHHSLHARQVLLRAHPDGSARQARAPLVRIRASLAFPSWLTPCPPSSTPRSTPVRDENGIIVDFETEGEFPKYGNDDDRVDSDRSRRCAPVSWVHPHERHVTATPCPTSVLTITSNVVYGKKTGSTPDGRKAGEPFAPGANPMHKRAIGTAPSLRCPPFQAPVPRRSGRHLQHLLHRPGRARQGGPGVLWRPGPPGDIQIIGNPVACCDCTDSSAPEGAVDGE